MDDDIQEDVPTKYEMVRVEWAWGIPGLKPFVIINSETGEIVEDEIERKCKARRYERSKSQTLAYGSNRDRVTKVTQK